jgi:hypothetical protein
VLDDDEIADGRRGSFAIPNYETNPLFFGDSLVHLLIIRGEYLNHSRLNREASE